MKTIEISDERFAQLKAIADILEKTPGEVCDYMTDAAGSQFTEPVEIASYFIRDGMAWPKEVAKRVRVRVADMILAEKPGCPIRAQWADNLKNGREMEQEIVRPKAPEPEHEVFEVILEPDPLRKYKNASEQYGVSVGLLLAATAADLARTNENTEIELDEKIAERLAIDSVRIWRMKHGKMLA